jgi:histidine triad (HIT) family protein
MVTVSIFSRILQGEIPATFVYTDDICGVFMPINPLAIGHVLVVPRLETDHWIDLPVEVCQHLMSVAHRMGKAQQAAFGCARVGVIIAGYEVPHVHIHVIPTNSMHEMNFANAAAHVDRDELERAAGQIVQHLAD